jgi:cytochrome P450
MLDPVGNRAVILLMLISGGRIGIGGRMERFEQRRRAVDEMIYAEIARRRDAADLEERTDVLSMLLLARDEDGEALTDAELRDELVTLLVAGHETTATGLSWAFEELLRNPRVLERTQTAVAEEDTAYLDAVVKETLRVRPVVIDVARVVKRAVDIDGWTIPAGAIVVPAIALVQLRPDLYPEPREFRPERFLGDDQPPSYSWIPFGGGVRRCIGAAFAQIEIKTVLRTVLTHVRLSAPDPTPERQLSRHVTLVPSQEATAVVDSRLDGMDKRNARLLSMEA